MDRHRRGLLPPALLLVLLGPALAVPASAQERNIVFHQVNVSGTEAGLTVEFADGEELSVTFRNDRILANGEELGGYSAGGTLEGAWRAFLGRAVAADNEELGRLLREWSPPPGLEGEAAEAARALDGRLERALAAPGAAPTPAPAVLHPEGDVQELVERLVLRTDRLRALAAAARQIRTEGLRVHVGEEVRVEEGEVVPGSLLVLDGELTLDGEVEGDVILLGGRVALGEAARIGGDLRWSDAAVSGNRAAVTGSIQEVQPLPDRSEAALRDEIRDEIRSAMRAATSSEANRRTGLQLRGTSALRNIARGVGSLLQTLVTFAILFGMGLLALYFAPRNFEVAARTARHATGRSALVGLAGGLLALPLWIVGIVLLAVTIIGIPVMLLWLPLFPLAVALAFTFGYLAVARNFGRWVSDRHVQLESLDPSRPAVQLGAGLVLLLVAFALAGIFQMGGAWLSLFTGLLTFVGVLLSLFAGMVGFGAVLLSRGGRDPVYAGPGWSFTGETDPWAPEGRPFASRSGFRHGRTRGPAGPTDEPTRPAPEENEPRGGPGEPEGESDEPDGPEAEGPRHDG